jgi:hypothetical protein
MRNVLGTGLWVSVIFAGVICCGCSTDFGAQYMGNLKQYSCARGREPREKCEEPKRQYDQGERSQAPVSSDVRPSKGGAGAP